MSFDCFDPEERRFEVEGIAVTPQESHAGGSLISQRECAGFNCPPLSIPAEEPVSISPSAVRRIGTKPGTGVMPDPAISRPHIATVFLLASVLPAALFPFCAGVPAIVVGHPVIAAMVAIEGEPVPGRSNIAKSGPADVAFCVGQPDKIGALPDVVTAMFSAKVLASEIGKITKSPGHHGIGAKVYGPRKAFAPDAFAEGFQPCARSAQIGRPEGVTRCFHVSRYKIEPVKGIFARNLLTNDDCRATLADEPMPVGPEVPLVVKPIAFACRAERLARAGAGPDRTVVGPSGRAEGEGPDADSGEEMALSKSSKLVWGDVTD